MTDRYPFQAHEQYCQKQWAHVIFSGERAVSLKDALQMDIIYRQNGKKTQKGEAQLLSMGILMNGPLDIEEQQKALLYGADAWRLALILEKNTTNLRPYWKLVQKWYNLLPMNQEILLDELSSPLFIKIVQAVQQNDLYHILTEVKALLKKDLSPQILSLCAAILAPFVPHLLNTYLKDAPTVYAFLKKLNLKPITITVNNKFIATFIPYESDFDAIQKEALKCPKVQRKIGQRKIKKCIFVPGKVLNVIC